jgi:hypothetical protein
LDVHLRIKEASRSLNDTNSLIESLNLINRARLTSHHRNDIESQILGVEISGEAERQRLLLPSRNLNIVSCVGEIADNGSRGMTPSSQWLESGQCASNDGDIDRLGLVVGEIEEGLCRVPIYKLASEDFRLWEGGRDRDGKIGGCWGRLELFFSLDDDGVSFLSWCCRLVRVLGNWLTDSGAAKTLAARRARRARVVYLEKPILPVDVVKWTRFRGLESWKRALVLLRCVQQFSELLAYLPATYEYSTIHATVKVQPPSFPMFNTKLFSFAS